MRLFCDWLDDWANHFLATIFPFERISNTLDGLWIGLLDIEIEDEFRMSCHWADASAIFGFSA